ncbi:glutaredoxin-1-like [Liolophura sinensis]|uniref:glutaredoxin-1-like n=1 Tax=Liolophura sinensis TaxID=3198878 RepID=UPI0031583A74
MAGVKEIVNAKIAGKKVMVFSKSYCPFCTKAKQAFQQLISEGVLPTDDYEVMEIENHPNCDDIQNYLGTLTGGRSVPRVFVNGEFLGGGDDTVRMKQNGELEAKLR